MQLFVGKFILNHTSTYLFSDHLNVFISQNEECPDRFVVFGGSYCSIREAMAQAAVTGQFDALEKALKVCIYIN